MKRNSSKHTILVVANSTWNIYNFRLNLVKYLCEHDISVIVAAPVDQYIRYLYIHPNVSHVPVRHLRRDSTGLFSNLRLLHELWVIYKEVKPDLIIQYTIKPNIFGSMAARSLGIPCMSVITGLGYTFMENDLLNKVVRQLYRIALKKNAAVVFENPDDQQLFLKKNIISPAQGTVVNGCGIDTQYFQPVPGTRNDHTFTFTFIGRLLYDKGILEFVEAATLLKKRGFHVVCWVVGDADVGNPSSVHKRDLLKWVKSRTIIYKGETRRIKSVLSKTDCLVLPSYREGLPKSILEAMSMEVPVITTDVPGCRQAVIHGENGFLVPVKNAEALATAMETMVELTEPERQRMGKQARRRANERYTDEVVVGQYGKLINQTIPVLDDQVLQEASKCSVL